VEHKGWRSNLQLQQNLGEVNLRGNAERWDRFHHIHRQKKRGVKPRFAKNE
jgi:hypothetical protein